MKIFVSWSGEASHKVADVLKSWLPTVLPNLNAEDVFLSSSDIAKGEQWMSKLDEVLEAHDFGILCLTRQNMTAPWILYEAGALSKRFKRARIAPLLIGIKNNDLTGPLAHWNAAGIDKSEMRKLVGAINKQMGRTGITEPKLDKIFDALWKEVEPSLAAAQQKAVSTAADYDYDVFLSAPMAAYTDDARFAAARLQVKKVFDALTGQCGYRVFWAAEKIERLADFDTIDVSVGGDLRALESSRYFVLVYPEKLATSALFEAGYACALKRPSHFFVRERRDLPFLMRELPGAVATVRVHGADDWTDYDDLARKLCKHKDRWFPP